MVILLGPPGAAEVMGPLDLRNKRWSCWRFPWSAKGCKVGHNFTCPCWTHQGLKIHCKQLMGPEMWKSPLEMKGQEFGETLCCSVVLDYHGQLQNSDPFTHTAFWCQPSPRTFHGNGQRESLYKLQACTNWFFSADATILKNKNQDLTVSAYQIFHPV